MLLHRMTAAGTPRAKCGKTVFPFKHRPMNSLALVVLRKIFKRYWSYVRDFLVCKPAEGTGPENEKPLAKGRQKLCVAARSRPSAIDYATFGRSKNQRCNTDRCLRAVVLRIGIRPCFFYVRRCFEWIFSAAWIFADAAVFGCIKEKTLLFVIVDHHKKTRSHCSRKPTTEIRRFGKSEWREHTIYLLL